MADKIQYFVIQRKRREPEAALQHCVSLGMLEVKDNTSPYFHGVHHAAVLWLKYGYVRGESNQ